MDVSQQRDLISKAAATDSRMILGGEAEAQKEEGKKKTQAAGFKAQVYFSACEHNQREGSRLYAWRIRCTAHVDIWACVSVLQHLATHPSVSAASLPSFLPFVFNSEPCLKLRSAIPVIPVTAARRGLRSPVTLICFYKKRGELRIYSNLYWCGFLKLDSISMQIFFSSMPALSDCGAWQILPVLKWIWP